jgi:Protein of unknown function (DUF2846)
MPGCIAAVCRGSFEQGRLVNRLKRGEGKMRAYRVVIACIVALATAACATVSTTTLEPQSKQRDPRVARLYFIWPRSWMMKTGTLDIKVNGEVVGKIAPDSYFFIDRKPGTYTLSIEPPFDFTYFQADVQVAAGGTYYYSVNSAGGTVPLGGGGFVTLQPTPTTGAPLEAKSGMLATYKLRAMDAAAAAAAMKDLDAR